MVWFGFSKGKINDGFCYLFIYKHNSRGRLINFNGYYCQLSEHLFSNNLFI
jgi:hypothetical protein